MNNLRVFNGNTRAAQRVTIHVERYNNIKYKNSPFYKGAELCNLLPLDIISSDSILQFKKELKRKKKTFCDTAI